MMFKFSTLCQLYHICVKQQPVDVSVVVFYYFIYCILQKLKVNSNIKRGKESGEFQFMSSTTAKFRSLLGRSRAKDVTQMGAFRSLSYTSYCYNTRGDVVNLVRCLVEPDLTC